MDNQEKINELLGVFDNVNFFNTLPFGLERLDLRSKILAIRGFDLPSEAEVLAWKELGKKKGSNPMFIVAFCLSLGFLHRIPSMVFQMHIAARKSAAFFVEIDKIMERMAKEEEIKDVPKGNTNTKK